MLIAAIALQSTQLAPLHLLPDQRCEPTSTEVVVCARDTQRRYRLPLPHPGPDETPHDTQTGTAALTPPGRCGIFTGERRCGKAEAARYGYGNGRDPITALAKLTGKLLHPDRDVAPPPAIDR